MIECDDISRREFVKTSAAAAAAFAASPAIARTQVRPERARLRKALKYGMIVEGSSVIEKFRIARESGFEGVEMDSPGGPPADEVRRASEETGLEVPGVVDSVHWRQTLGDPDAEVRAQGRDRKSVV